MFHRLGDCGNLVQNGNRFLFISCFVFLCVFYWDFNINIKMNTFSVTNENASLRGAMISGSLSGANHALLQSLRNRLAASEPVTPSVWFVDDKSVYAMRVNPEAEGGMDRVSAIASYIAQATQAKRVFAGVLMRDTQDSVATSASPASSSTKRYMAIAEAVSADDHCAALFHFSLPLSENIIAHLPTVDDFDTLSREQVDQHDLVLGPIYSQPVTIEGVPVSARSYCVQMAARIARHKQGPNSGHNTDYSPPSPG